MYNWILGSKQCPKDPVSHQRFSCPRLPVACLPRLHVMAKGWLQSHTPPLPAQGQEKGERRALVSQECCPPQIAPRCSGSCGSLPPPPPPTGRPGSRALTEPAWGGGGGFHLEEGWGTEEKLTRSKIWGLLPGDEMSLDFQAQDAPSVLRPWQVRARIPPCMCDCRPFEWKIVFGSQVPSHPLPQRQFNFYAFMRTFSLSAGVTNGVQKAFNGLPPALQAVLCSAEPYSTWLEPPRRSRLPNATGWRFCAAPFRLKATSSTTLENNGWW